MTYACGIVTELHAAGARAVLDAGSEKMQGKIQDAERMKVHTMVVIGKRDLEAGNVSVRVLGKGNLGAKPRTKVIADLLTAIQERRKHLDVGGPI